jgi:hypothetical protein
MDRLEDDGNARAELVFLDTTPVVISSSNKMCLGCGNKAALIALVECGMQLEIKCGRLRAGVSLAFGWKVDQMEEKQVTMSEEPGEINKVVDVDLVLRGISQVNQSDLHEPQAPVLRSPTNSRRKVTPAKAPSFVRSILLGFSVCHVGGRQETPMKATRLAHSQHRQRTLTAADAIKRRALSSPVSTTTIIMP